MSSPSITKVSYNANTGLIQITGANLVSGIVLADITLSWGNKSFILNPKTDQVNNLNANGFTVSLSSSDKASINSFFNFNGTSSGGNYYYLNASSGWDAGYNSTASSKIVTVAGSNSITLAGISLNTSILDIASCKPFSYLTISDSNTNENDNASITFNAANGVLSGAGLNAGVVTDNSITYTINTTSRTTLQTILHGLVFSPTIHQTTIGLVTSTNLSLTVNGNTAIYPLATVTNSNTIVSSTATVQTINGISYNASTGKLTLTGNYFTSKASDYTPTDLTLKGQGGISYTLTGGNVEANPTATKVIIDLNSTDQLAVAGLLDKNGAKAIDKTAYALSATSGWDSGANAINNQALSVNSVVAPKISSVLYNGNTGTLTISASHLQNQGTLSAINLSSLTLSAGLNSYTLKSGVDTISFINGGAFNAQLSKADQQLLNAIFNIAGSKSASGSSYYLTTPSGWDNGVGAAIKNQAVIVSYPPANAPINVTLTDTTTSQPFSSFNVNDTNTNNLYTAIITGINQVNGTLTGSSLSSTTDSNGNITYAFNIPGSTTSLQQALQSLVFTPTAHQTAANGQFILTLNVIGNTTNTASSSNLFSFTVTESAAPTLSTIIYNTNTGLLTFTGSNLLESGNFNLAINNFTLSSSIGQYTLNNNDTLSNVSANGFNVILSSADQALVDRLFPNNGGNNNYTLATSALWDGAGSSASNYNITVTGNNTISLSGFTNSQISDVSTTHPFNNLVINDTDPNDRDSASLAFPAANGTLSLNGNNLTPIITGTQAVYNFAASSATNLQQLLQSLIFTPTAHQLSTGNTITNNFALTINGSNSSLDSVSIAPTVTVTSSSAPTISSALYNAATGVLTVTGDNLLESGVFNIVLSDLSLVSGSNQYTLDDNNDSLSNFSANGFSITLNSSDKATVNSFFNSNTSTNNSYYLSTAMAWNGIGSTSSNTSVTVTGNNSISLTGINQNYANTDTSTLQPFATLSLSDSDSNDKDSATISFPTANGTLSLNGTNLTPVLSGVLANYTLATTTAASLQQTLQNIIFTPTPHQSTSGNTITTNLTLSINGSNSSYDHASNTTTLTVNSSSAPIINGVSYNADTGVLSVSGSNILESGDFNLVLNNFILSSNTGQLILSAANDTLSNVSVNGFNVNLNSADKALVNALFTSNGSNNNYTLTTSALWDGAGSNTGSNPVTVTGNNTISLSGFSNSQISDITTTHPFSTLIINDSDVNDQDSASISFPTANGTLSLNGINLTPVINGTQAVYSFAASSAASLQQSLQSLIFTPTAHQLNPGYTVTSNFALTVNGSNSSLDTASNATTQITVTSSAVPRLIASSYNANTGFLTVYGSNILNAQNNSLVLGNLKLITGSNSYTLNATTDTLSNLTANSFTVSLGSLDKNIVNSFFTTNGTSVNGNSYILSASADWDGSGSAANNACSVLVSGNNTLNVSGFSNVSQLSDLNTISPFSTVIINDSDNNDTVSANISFAAANGSLSGSNLSTGVITNGIISYSLSATSPSNLQQTLENLVFIPTPHQVAAGQTVTTSLNLIINGTNSALDVASNNSTVLAVTNTAAPSLSTASYNASTGLLTVTGSNLVNNLNLADLQLSAGSNVFKLNSTDQISTVSTNGFTVALSATDQNTVNDFFNSNGTSNGNNSNYALSANSGWDGIGSTSINTNVTVSGNNTINLSGFSNSQISDVTTTQPFSNVIINDTDTNDKDKANISFPNANGTLSLNGTTLIPVINSGLATYTLAATTAASLQQTLQNLVFIPTPHQSTTGNTVTTNLTLSVNGSNSSYDNASNTTTLTVNSSSAPIINAVNYNAATGLLTFSGNNLLASGNFYLALNNFTLSANASQFSLSAANDTLSNVSANGFNVNLNSADKALVNALFTSNGSNNNYTLTTSALWDGAGSNTGSNPVTVTGNNTISLSGFSNSQISDITTTHPFSTLIINDSDVNDQDSASISFPTANGTLSLNGINLTPVINGTQAVYSFAASSAASLQQSLQSLIFTPTAHQLNPGYTVTSNFALTVNGSDSSLDTVSNSTSQITVTASAVPLVNTASYNANTGLLTLYGSNILNAQNNSLVLGDLKLIAGSNSFTLNAATDTIGNLTANSFTVSLGSLDKNIVNSFFTANGTSVNGTSYILSASAGWDGSGSAANNASSIFVSGNNTLNVSGFSNLAKLSDLNTISPFSTVIINDSDTNNTVSANISFAAANGSLSGSNLSTGVITNGIISYSLSATSPSNLQQTLENLVFIPTPHQVAAGQTVTTSLNLIINGTNSALDVASNNSTVLAVTNTAAPSLSTASYNASTGLLTVTGSNLVNNLNLADLQLSAGSNVFKLNSTDQISTVSTNGFTVALSATDQNTVNDFFNSNGTSNGNNSNYALSANSGWDGIGSTSINTNVTVSGNNSISLSNFQTISIADYNTVSPFSTIIINDTDANDLDSAIISFPIANGNLTGTGLSAGSSNGSTLSYTLSATSSANLQQELQNLIFTPTAHQTTAGQKINTTFNLTVNGSNSTLDKIVNSSTSVSVTATAIPTLNSANYNAATGTLTIAGSNLISNSNNIALVLNAIKLSQGSNSFNLNSTVDSVSNLTNNGFTVNLSPSDKAAVNIFFNTNGTSVSGNSYILSASNGWDGPGSSSVNLSGITVSAANSISASGFANTNSANDYTPLNPFSNTLISDSDSNDQDSASISFAAANGSLSGAGLSTGTNSGSMITYTLAATSANNLQQELQNLVFTPTTHQSTAGQTVSTAFNVTITGNDSPLDYINNTNTLVTVTSTASPTLSTVNYNATTGIISITGNNFLNLPNTNNNLTLNNFKLSLGSSSFILNQNTDLISNFTSTGFTITLGSNDKSAVNSFFNTNGTSLNGIPYNLTVNNGWDGNGSSSISNQNLTVTGANSIGLNGFTTSANIYDTSAITPFNSVKIIDTDNSDRNNASISFIAANGTLSGTGLSTGTINGSLVTYTFSQTTTANLQQEIESLVFTPTIHQVAATQTVTTNFNLNVYGSNSSLDVSSSNLTQVTVTATAAPSLTSASYNASTGVLLITGNNLLNSGTNNALSLANIRLSAGNSNFSLNANSDVLSNFTSSGFTVTLSSGDIAAINTFFNINGSGSTNNPYLLIANSGWDGVGSNAISQNVTVTGANSITLSGFSNLSNLSDLNTVLPFSTVQINDSDSNDKDSVSISFAAANGILTGTGISGSSINSGIITYTLATNNASTLQQELDNLTFTPTIHQVSAGQTVTTSFSINVSGNDSNLDQASNTSNVTVTASPAPTLTTAVYNASLGVLTITGSNLNNSLILTDLSLKMGSSYYTLTNNDQITSISNGFNITLSANDKNAVNTFLNVNGNAYANIPYLLSTSNGWDGLGSTAISNQSLSVVGANSISLSGFTSNTTISDVNTTSPFSKLSISDSDSNDQDSATISLTAANGSLSGEGLSTGSTSGGIITYTLSATTASNLQTELNALVFTPTAHQVAAGQVINTNLILTVSGGNSSFDTVNNTSTIISTTATANSFTIGTSTTINNPSLISNIHTADQLIIADANSFNSTTITATNVINAGGNVNTLAGWVNAALSPQGVNIASHEIAWFTFSNNTYFVEQANNQGSPFTAGDTLIELVGQYNESTASFSGHTITVA